MRSDERDRMAEDVCLRVATWVEREGAVSGANTAMCTVMQAPDGNYTVSVTILVQKIEVLPQPKGGE